MANVHTSNLPAVLLLVVAITGMGFAFGWFFEKPPTRVQNTPEQPLTANTSHPTTTPFLETTQNSQPQTSPSIPFASFHRADTSDLPVIPPPNSLREWEIALAANNNEKLAAALAIVEQPNHPLREDALRLIRRFLGGDFGEDPLHLRQLIQEKLHADLQLAEQIRHRLEQHRKSLSSNNP
ncbi:MAG: hypothetical protein N2035_10485 [Chthoniobacterales bacterium]|nr:hypothetical protein [Chthoniobacterales bacterium]